MTWSLFAKVVGVSAKRDRKRQVRRSDSRQLRVSDERRDPPDVEKLANVLIGLAREQEPNQPEAATESCHKPTSEVGETPELALWPGVLPNARPECWNYEELNRRPAAIRTLKWS